MSGNEKSFSTYNYKAEWANKITQAQTANGEIQLKETTFRSDTIEGLIELGFKTIKDWYKLGKKEHLNVKSPYEKGYVPTDS